MLGVLDAELFLVAVDTCLLRVRLVLREQRLRGKEQSEGKQP
jgi:hypothetical protein